MEVCNKLFLLKKSDRQLKPEEILFFKRNGIIYEGQYSMPKEFFSQAVSNRATIVIVDLKGYDELKYIDDMLCSLQDFTNCEIILVSDLPNGYVPNYKIREANPNIDDKLLKISDCLLKIKKDQESSSNNGKRKFYTKVQELLTSLGFDNGQLGFGYLCDAIYYVHFQRKFNVKLVAEVYQYVANKNETTVTRVERDIRSAISNAMANCNHKMLREDPNLKGFDVLMHNTTCKGLLQAVVNYIKYNTTFN